MRDGLQLGRLVARGVSHLLIVVRMLMKLLCLSAAMMFGTALLYFAACVSGRGNCFRSAGHHAKVVTSTAGRLNSGIPSWWPSSGTTWRNSTSSVFPRASSLPTTRFPTATRRHTKLWRSSEAGLWTVVNLGKRSMRGLAPSLRRPAARTSTPREKPDAGFLDRWFLTEVIPIGSVEPPRCLPAKPCTGYQRSKR